MGIRDLFPADAPRARMDLYDRHGYVNGKTVTLTECQRCGAWISYKPRHVAWHRGVDTAETPILVPTDTQGDDTPWPEEQPAQHTPSSSPPANEAPER